MKILKNFFLAIHIVVVIAIIVYTFTFNHAVFGTDYSRCEQYEDGIYLIENTRSNSILYRGDTKGNVFGVYRSNQGQGRVTIVGIDISDDVYILENSRVGYAIKKLNSEKLIALSNTKPFILGDVDGVSDFYINSDDNMAYITAVRDNGIGAYVYGYNLSNLFPLGADETKMKSGEKPMELPVRYRYDAVSETITAAYYDGSNIIPEARPLSENAKDPESYAPIMELTLSQCLKANVNVFLIYFAYAVIGWALIILIFHLISKRRRVIDLILINEIFILAAMVLGLFLLGNTTLIVIWTVVASIANIFVILFENRDIFNLCENMKRIINGNLDLEKPKGNSEEISILWRGMNEVKYLYEEYKYIQDTTTAAVLRFLPHNIGSMFKANSLDGIKPGDSVNISGTFMSFRTHKEISNNLISLTEDYEKSADGTLLTGECSLQEIRMLFSKSSTEPVNLGLNFFSKIEDESACALYFKDNFKISVVGTPTKSILNLTSSYMESMERLGEWFFDMGIRMVITEDVKEMAKELTGALRFIGYCNVNDEKKSFYEVIDAYEERTRSNRLGTLKDFDTALGLLYQNDYYLARTAFTDILKVDPSDEITRWYLFICEKHLNNPEISDRSLYLDPRN